MDKVTIPSDRLLADAVHLLISSRGPRYPEGVDGRKGPGAHYESGGGSAGFAVSPVGPMTRQDVRHTFQQITGISPDAPPDRLLPVLKERFQRVPGGTRYKYLPPPPGSVPGSLIGSSTSEHRPPDGCDEWSKDLQEVRARFLDSAREALRRAEAIAPTLKPVAVVDMREVDAARDVLLTNLRSFVANPGIGPYGRVIARQLIDEDLPRFGVVLGLVKGTVAGSRTSVLDPIAKNPVIDDSNIVTLSERQALADFVSLQDAVRAVVQSWCSMVTLQNSDLVGSLDRLARGLAVLAETTVEAMETFDAIGLRQAERRLIRAWYARDANDVCCGAEPARFDLDLDQVINDTRNFARVEAPRLIRAGGKVGVRQIEVRSRELRRFVNCITRKDRWKKEPVTSKLGGILFDNLLEEIDHDLHRVELEASAIVTGKTLSADRQLECGAPAKRGWGPLAAIFLPFLGMMIQTGLRRSSGGRATRRQTSPPGPSPLHDRSAWEGPDVPPTPPFRERAATARGVSMVRRMTDSFADRVAEYLIRGQLTQANLRTLLQDVLEDVARDLRTDRYRSYENEGDYSSQDATEAAASADFPEHVEAAENGEPLDYGVEEQQSEASSDRPAGKRNRGRRKDGE